LGVARLQNGLAPLQNAFTALQNGLAPLQNAFAALFHVLAVVRGAIARLFRRLDGLLGFLHLIGVFPQTGYEHICLVDFVQICY
jgi:hypothetical protein